MFPEDGEAATWVTDSCRHLGLAVSSPGETAQDRPWSRAVVYDIHQADGTDGRVWFKANGAGTRHEPRLLSALASLVPDLVPEVLAINPDQGWSLTRDAGQTWRSAIAVSDHWPLWEDLVQRYAAAQLGLAAHQTELLTTGIPERSPATLPQQATDLIAEMTLAGSDDGGLSAVDSDELTARLPQFGQWCRVLDDSGIASTIQHDDLHSNNICLTATNGSRIIDWGDASIGHPFGTMLVTLGSIAHYGGCEVDDPRVQRVRDAYLEPFTAYAHRSELIAQVDIARRVGVVTRALSWRGALIESPPSVHLEYDFPVRDWLLELSAAP